MAEGGGDNNIPSSKGKAPERLTDNRSCVEVLKVTDNSLLVKAETDCDPDALREEVGDTIQTLNETTVRQQADDKVSEVLENNQAKFDEFGHINAKIKQLRQHRSRVDQ